VYLEEKVPSQLPMLARTLHGEKNERARAWDLNVPVSGRKRNVERAGKVKKGLWGVASQPMGQWIDAGVINEIVCSDWSTELGKNVRQLGNANQKPCKMEKI